MWLSLSWLILLSLQEKSVVISLLMNTIVFARIKCGYLFLFTIQQLFPTACSMVEWRAIFWQYSGVCSLVGLSHIGPLGHAGDRPDTQHIMASSQHGPHVPILVAPHFTIETWPLANL